MSQHQANDTSPPRRPNVIWVFGDQHREQAMSGAGDPNLITPNLDRLAVEGVRLRGVAGAPLCCPYRGCLLTSRYAHNTVPGHEQPLDPALPTVAHAFHDAGYDTAWFGKWHLDGFEEWKGRPDHHRVPPHRRGGFGTWIGYENNNSQWDCHVHGHRGDEPVPLHRLDGYETDALTDRFIDYLADHAPCDGDAQRRPFFAALSVQPPHAPCLAPAQWMGRHHPRRVELRPNVPHHEPLRRRARTELAGYYAQIENLDHNLGRIRAALTRLGLDRDTYLLFFSDHGDMMGSHGLWRKIVPYEESIRVPMFIAGAEPYHPHHSGRAGVRHDVLVNHVDLAPTSLGLCGLEKPGWMLGRDLSGCYRKDRPAPDRANSVYLQHCRAPHHGNVDQPWRGLLTADGWKLAVFPDHPWLMFNLNEDPYEQANLAFRPRHRAKRDELMGRLREWMREVDDPFFSRGF